MPSQQKIKSCCFCASVDWYTARTMKQQQHTHTLCSFAYPARRSCFSGLRKFFSEVSRINVKKIRCETGGHAWSFHLSYVICTLYSFQIPPTGQTCSTSTYFGIQQHVSTLRFKAVGFSCWASWQSRCRVALAVPSLLS